jgi:apolipoprotein N-acyltransferase
VTAIVDPRGAVAARLPAFTEGALEGRVEGRVGATPYVRLGNALAVSVSLAIVGWAALAARRTRAKARRDTDLLGDRPPVKGGAE